MSHNIEVVNGGLDRIRQDVIDSEGEPLGESQFSLPPIGGVQVFYIYNESSIELGGPTKIEITFNGHNIFLEPVSTGSMVSVKITQPDGSVIERPNHLVMSVMPAFTIAPMAGRTDDEDDDLIRQFPNLDLFPGGLDKWQRLYYEKY